MQIFERLKLPRLAASAVEVAIGLLVAGEFLFGRVPLQRTFQLVGNLAQVAHDRGVHRQLDIAERLLTSLHAFDEVAVNAAVPLVAWHRFRVAFLARRAFDPKVARCSACCASVECRWDSGR